MEALMKNWPGYVLSRYDQPTGTWMFIAIRATTFGDAAGGTRMKSYAGPRKALQDAMRLAEGMNNKFALANLNLDGAKAVLAIPADFDPAQREGLLIRYGQWLNSLGGLFSTAADMGTTIDDMVLLKQHYDGIFGLPSEQGGMGDQGPPTALGVFCGIQAACEHHFGTADLAERTVLVQGVGGVGGALVDLLLEAGCSVKFSDFDAGLIARYRDERGLTFVEADAAYAEPCDVFAPCATGGILNSRTIPTLAAAIVAGSANNQLEKLEDGEQLHERGMLYAPDYVINAGAAIYATAIEADGLSATEGEARVRKIGDTLREIFERARATGSSPSQVAEQLAAEKIRQREAHKT